MHLWSDYEGKTIAGNYPLSKLLRSEGRNAFFAASNPQGSAAVVRLTEAHFDEREMLNRWGKVVELHQPSLLGIETFGETTVDGVTLTYAVLESNDANLAEVLKERPLTSAETLQVANNVASALAALHASGMVHEHVEPRNVFAVGEDVKLRSDCVRECVADMEFNSAQQCDQARKRDVHDLGVLLLRCLTLDRTLAPGTRLAAPFDQIIPHALDGSWSLEQILAAVEASAPASALTANAAGAQGPGPRASAPLVPESVLAQAAPAGAAGVQPLPVRAPAPLPANALRRKSDVPEQAPRLTPRAYVPAVEHATLRPRSVWALGIVAASLILLGWFFLFRTPTRTSASKPAGTPSRSIAPASTAFSPALPSAVAAGHPAKPSATQSSVPAFTQPGWRVIAYTYDREAPARAQAERLNRLHPALAAQVFSPRGGAPYLIALSGPVTEQQARVILDRARRDGAPRDTFLRRY